MRGEETPLLLPSIKAGGSLHPPTPELGKVWSRSPPSPPSGCIPQDADFSIVGPKTFVFAHARAGKGGRVRGGQGDDGEGEEAAAF